MQGVRKHSNPITGKVLQRNGARTMYVGDKLIMIDYTNVACQQLQTSQKHTDVQLVLHSPKML